MISRIDEYVEDDFSWDQSFGKYVRGYGNVQGQFWLGLSTIHSLNQNFGNNVLRIEATAHNGTEIWVEFDNFQIKDRCTFIHYYYRYYYKLLHKCKQ